MIDFYLASCAEKGKNPKEIYNGELLFCIPGELYESIERSAAGEGKSINE